ncbi:MAG: TetR/AcrR family transcriptional regulator [Cyclobacteriaceae bacterium]
MSDIKQPWINAGYELFSKHGPDGLKVEVISRIVGKSKSSFYHHFADLEVFTAHLLRHHLQRSDIIVEKESQCKNVVPELLHVLVEHKQDLLFNRQLRVHRSNPEFEACFQKTSAEVGGAVLGIWAEALNLQDNSNLALMILRLSLENFYLQITEDTLTYEWLEKYLKDLQTMAGEFSKQPVR